jgi:predicted nucleotidyltransferase component of viral defense system
MIDLNKHKVLMLQILKEIYSDIELSNCLGFKGGTALMFFYDLPRFSIDLDFNLIDPLKEDIVYEKVRKILLKFGSIFDEAKKFYGLIVVLDYGIGERKLKVEILNRLFDNHYQIKNLLGINIKLLVIEDMFAHKLCSLLDRGTITNRDIFDCHFFMQNRTTINKSIVEMRMQTSLAEYFQRCIDALESMSNRGILNGLGELMDDERKKFVRTKLLDETIGFLRFYKEYMLLS